jgi:hypothetical protein
MVKRRLKVNGEIVTDDYPSAGRTLILKEETSYPIEVLVFLVPWLS